MSLILSLKMVSTPEALKSGFYRVVVDANKIWRYSEKGVG